MIDLQAGIECQKEACRVGGQVAERKLGRRGKKLARGHVAIHLWAYHIYSMADVSNGLGMDGYSIERNTFYRSYITFHLLKG
jgi:hypothetical protein